MVVDVSRDVSQTTSRERHDQLFSSGSLCGAKHYQTLSIANTEFVFNGEEAFEHRCASVHKRHMSYDAYPGS